ncbi:MAG: hypothetical protein KJ914_10815 [Gammaproteobacteria bacterium]|nr:hypothetical protein [Gammaproteobacteria bacterium]MBU1723745.1 hypothetical protein [Gammaproteobacteria bacterium]MBU2004068.1 hypothetical protein [Gammaproteobacteria bacterium]
MRIEDPVTLVGLIASLLLAVVAVVLYWPDFTSADAPSAAPTTPPQPALAIQPAPPPSSQETIQSELQRILEQVEALEQENNRLQQEITKAEQESRKLDKEINDIRPE